MEKISNAIPHQERGKREKTLFHPCVQRCGQTHARKLEYSFSLAMEIN